MARTRPARRRQGKRSSHDFPRDHLLPTALGNVLRAMEERAGPRYGIESIGIWRRLYPVLPKNHAQTLEDEVTQLDVSVHSLPHGSSRRSPSSTFVMRDPTSAWSNWRWLVVIGLVFLAAWLSYRSAIESALAHSSDVEVTLDLYRDLLLDASRMEPAGTLTRSRSCSSISASCTRPGIRTTALTTHWSPGV